MVVVNNKASIAMRHLALLSNLLPFGLSLAWQLLEIWPISSVRLFFYFTPAAYHLFTTCGVCYDRPWPTQLFSRTLIDTGKKLDLKGHRFVRIRVVTFSYSVFLGDQLLTWFSQTSGQRCLIPRCEAEIPRGGEVRCSGETSWIRNLLRELHTPLFTATLVYCDNVSAVYMSANLVQHQRTKHIEIDIHFIRDKVAAGHVRVFHVPSRFQYADIFTKGLPYPLFADFRSSLSVRKTPAPTAGAY
ncbi:ribonuclease H-like domain-containing protein [Tanacetum coccineum]